MDRQKVFTTALIVLEAFILAAVVIIGVATKTVEGVQTLVDDKKEDKVSVEDETDVEDSKEDTSEENVTEPKEYVETRLTFSAEVEQKIAQMSKEEMVAQLFMVSPEELTGYGQVTVSGNSTKTAINQYPVGGFIYTSLNFLGQAQAEALVSGAQGFSQERIGLPLFITVAEGVNEVVIQDTFQPLKYFPIEGNESGTGGLNTEIAQFQTGINNGASVIMVSNGIAPSVTGVVDLPCSMADNTVKMLRGQMGFKGILITAPYDEATITGKYSAGDAAVAAIKAGMDMIYSPVDFKEAYTAVLGAVNSGAISQMRLENAVGRVLTEKME